VLELDGRLVYVYMSFMYENYSLDVTVAGIDRSLDGGANLTGL
jgi:hypothetical protein